MNDIIINKNINGQCIKMKKIFIDYDTTLVDFQDVMTHQINQIENTNFSSLELSRGYHDEIKMRNKHIFTHQNIYEDIVPFEGAIEFLIDIKSKGYDIILITANMSELQKTSKEIHIEKYFKGIFDDIIHTEDKYKYTKESILIDDSYANITKHIQANDQIGILFNLNKQYIITDKLDLHIDKLHHIDSFEGIYPLLP